jgi:phosphocarrier protein
MSEFRGEETVTTARATFQIVNKLGMHARAATKLVQLASKYRCEIELTHAGQSANAKSVMGVLLLCGSKGSRLEVVATGEGAQEAVDRIGELIGNRFGEEE